MRNYLAIILLLFLGGCHTSQNEVYQPKAKGFNRIDLPPRAYSKLLGNHPYIFDVSKSAVVQRDTFAHAEPHWIILYYPTLQARIQLTYKQVFGDPVRLQNMINDAYKLAEKHQVKATSEEVKMLKFKDGKVAYAIELEGAVPSHYQFYTTDTTKNYLRGAVYLSQATENDSLRPIVDYMKVEALHLLETLKWKNEPSKN